MKGVFLIGDSIRLGYERYVKAMLDGIATVYAPAQNCGLAQFVQRWVHVWALNEGVPKDVDVVHWNAGLWDVLRIFDDGPLSSPEFYAQSLERVHGRLKMLFPKAKIIFALSTCVREEEYQGEYKRWNREIDEYNQIAIKTLGALGETFDDLYSITENAPKECYSDSTHFNTVAGIKLVGGKVIDCLCEALEIDRSSLAEKEAELFEIPQSILGN